MVTQSHTRYDTAPVNVARTAYYCAYTKTYDELPRRSIPFATEQGARAHARQLARQGYWGAIERHCKAKRDYGNDEAWYVAREDAGEETIELLEYF